jgi:hypothetical protein
MSTALVGRGALVKGSSFAGTSGFTGDTGGVGWTAGAFAMGLADTGVDFGAGFGAGLGLLIGTAGCAFGGDCPGGFLALMFATTR